MLIGIPPLLTPELLKLMMEMGHDDALVLADANFTAMRIAAGKPVIRLPGARMLPVVQAVTALLPLATDATRARRVSARKNRLYPRYRKPGALCFL